MMYKNKSSLWLTLGAAALLIGGGFATYYVVVSRKALENVPIGATIVPQDAMMAVSFSTEPKQWEKLREYGTTESKAALNKTIGQWRDRLFTNSGFDYQRHSTLGGRSSHGSMATPSNHHLRHTPQTGLTPFFPHRTRNGDGVSH